MKQVFLIAPSNDEPGEIVQAIHTAAGLVHETARVIFPGAVPNAKGSVLTGIQASIRAADLVVADLSAASPSTLWELGYAQAVGKPAIVLTTDPGAVPFDVRTSDVIVYRSTSQQSLAVRIAGAMVRLWAPAQDAAGLGPPTLRPTAFVSYCHVDAAYLERVLVHVRPLERAGLLEVWSDTKINVGDRWRAEIEDALGRARAAVLLISADFLASDFVVNEELPKLLAAAEEKGTRIIPLILKPCRFARDPSLMRFQALNGPNDPLIRMNEADREALYAKLAEVLEAELTR